MENIQCLVVSFKQTDEAPEYVYFVSEREILPGDLYIDASKSNFMKVAYMRTQKVNERCRKIEATDNPKYLLGNITLQQVPKSFSEAYFASGRKPKQAPLRVKTK